METYLELFQTPVLFLLVFTVTLLFYRLKFTVHEIIAYKIQSSSNWVCIENLRNSFVIEY